MTTEPGFRQPMLATLVDEVPHGEDWIFERKLDGVRLVVVRDRSSIRLFSRNHKDRTALYPELVDPLLVQSPARFVADGEVVAFDGAVTSFSRLQQRGGVSDPAGAEACGIAIHLYLFDLLHLDGNDLDAVPLRARKKALLDTIRFDDPIRFCAHRNNTDDGSAGETYREEACEKGWEGLVAKRADGRYVHGRSRDWVKLKCVARQEFVIVGFSDPKGSRSALGALVIGYHDDDGELRYAGRVGTGFDDAELRRLHDLLKPAERREPALVDPPSGREAGDVHWVAPDQVCEVGFTEWTRAGRLRHPRYEGLRNDKDPHDVVRESPRSVR